MFGVVSGPSVPAGTVTHALASTLDIWPTVAALVQAPLPSDRRYDGVDLSPVLFDGAEKVRDVLFMPDTSGATHGNLTAVRYGNYSVYYQTNVSEAVQEPSTGRIHARFHGPGSKANGMSMHDTPTLPPPLLRVPFLHRRARPAALGTSPMRR